MLFDLIPQLLDGLIDLLFLLFFFLGFGRCDLIFLDNYGVLLLDLPNNDGVHPDFVLFQHIFELLKLNAPASILIELCKNIQSFFLRYLGVDCLQKGIELGLLQTRVFRIF